MEDGDITSEQNRFDKIVWKRGQRGGLEFELTISGSFDKDLKEKSTELLDWADRIRAERMIVKQLKERNKEDLLNE